LAANPPGGTLDKAHFPPLGNSTNWLFLGRFFLFCVKRLSITKQDAAHQQMSPAVCRGASQPSGARTMKLISKKTGMLLASVPLLLGLTFSAQAADIEAGEKVFHACRQCHHIGKGATNFYGPVLNGLVGRKAGTVPGYAYSAANKESGKVWDVPTLTSYLKKPQHDVPSTEMTFTGLKNDADIENVIAYIGQFDTSGGKK
jgi:cytochrome c